MSLDAPWRLDVQNVPDEELIAVTSLQGLVNRDRPRLYLSVVDRHWSMKFRPGEAIAPLPQSVARAPYRSCTDIWEDYYAGVQGLTFREADSLDQLLHQFADRVRGVIVVDLAQRGQYAIGATMAGLRDALLVSASALARHPRLAELPVLEDLRGKFTDPLDAHRWSMQNLLPLCNHKAVFSQTRTANEGDPDYFGLDLAVAQRLFVFSLCFRQARAPAEFALIEEILARIEPGSPMYGWGTSEESMMIGMARSGLVLVCTHTPNISFHARIKPRHTPLADHLPAHRPRPKLADRHYVTFMVNEGDTLKWMGNVMGHGQWLSPDRGAVPVNWGTNPWLVEKFPGMMELFYRTATPNECFFSSITGYGYYNPKHSSQTQRLAELEKQLNPAAGLTVGSIYSVHGMMDAVHGRIDEQTDRWLVARGCKGYAFESAQQPYVQYTSAGQPVIGVDWSLFYWMYRFEGRDPLEGAVERIMRIADEFPAPFFIPVYAGTPTQFKRMARMLPADRFEIVLLDEMVDLAIEARAQVEANAPKRRQWPCPPPMPRHSAARVVRAPRHRVGVWEQAERIEIDLSSFNAGRMRATLQLAWNAEHLHLRICERATAAQPLESLDQRSYEAGEFDVSDGIALWFDFRGIGSLQQGSFTPWLGFSSVGRNDLYCCQLNDRVLSSTLPRLTVRTQVSDGLRSIMAAIPWSELSKLLDRCHAPEGGLAAAARRGFRFGCQPLLVEGNAGRAFLNGRSNKRQNQTAVALQREGQATTPAPSGFDEHSISVELVD
jgi:hypothetical protein